MIFRQCSIGGKVYIGEQDLETPVQCPSKTQLDTNDDPTSTNTDNSALPVPSKTPLFKCPQLSSDLESVSISSLSPSNASHTRVLEGFFSVLALCHTVLTSTDKATGHLEYKAQSPDEEALVRAAADVGYVFKGREKELLYVETPFSRTKGKEKHLVTSTTSDDRNNCEKYELLNVLEFNSARKRMSVVVRKLSREKNEIFLLMKGADNVIFERLKEGDDEDLKEQTEKHLSEFANSGLRTLTLAYKLLSEEEYEAWSEKYYEATVAIEGREEMLDQVSDELEQDVRLLGATAIEDSLQDGVPETIADLKRAGIKIWVATGDKLETAVGACPYFCLYSKLMTLLHAPFLQPLATAPISSHEIRISSSSVEAACDLFELKLLMLWKSSSRNP